MNVLPDVYISSLWKKSVPLLPEETVKYTHLRGGSRAAATSRMVCFVIIVNEFQPLTIITKHSILDTPAALDPPLHLAA